MSDLYEEFSSLVINRLPSFGERTTEEVNRIFHYTNKVSLPAIITSIDDYESNQCLNVKPLIGMTDRNGEEVQPPELKKIFVKVTHGGDFIESFPVKVNGLVTLHWTHRSLNDYISGSGRELSYPIPEDAYDMKDCYITLGFGTKSNNQSPSKDNYKFRTESNTYSLVITPNGDLTEDSNSVALTNKSTTVTTESVEITSPSNKINGPLDITETTTAPIFQGVLQGPNGGNAVSDKEFTATKLHAQNGKSGSCLTADGKTLVFQDGILIGGL